MAEAIAERIAAKLRSATEISAARAKPEVRVAAVIHPGVTVRFPGLETLVSEPIPGPVRLSPRKRDGTWEIVATDEATGRCRALHTRVFPDPTDPVFHEFRKPATRGDQT